MADKDDIAWWSKGKLSRGMREDSAVLKKYLPNIAQNLNIIKTSLMSLVKVQEADKKTQYFERQKRRAEGYALRFKKAKPTKEDKKVVSAEKKSFMDIIKDGLASIFKFASLGLIAMGASKLLSLPGVMDGLKEFFKKFVLAVSDLIQKGISFLSDLLKDNEIINSLTSLVKKVFTFIADGVSKAADFFKTIITDPENKESIGKIIVAVIGTLFNGLMSAIEIAGKALSENQEAIKNGIVTIFVKIAEGIAGAVKFVDSLIQDPKFRDAVAAIYRSVLDFFNSILNEPIGSIAGQPVNLKMAAIALGAGFVLLEGVMAGLTAAIVAKSVGGALGLPSGGGAGGGGAEGTPSATWKAPRFAEEPQSQSDYVRRMELNRNRGGEANNSGERVLESDAFSGEAAKLADRLHKFEVPDELRANVPSLRGQGLRELGLRELESSRFYFNEGGDRFDKVVENGFVETKSEPLSTFSIDVDTASYTKLRQYVLEQNVVPQPESIRIEEWLNYFDYQYAGPKGDEPFAAHLRMAKCPWNARHQLVRVAIQAKRVESQERPASNLVFLIDVSG